MLTFVSVPSPHIQVDGKPIAKGIAYPTCICPNNIIRNFSPLKSDPVVVLAKGDLIKM